MTQLPPVGTAVQPFVQAQPGAMQPFAKPGVAIAAIVIQATPEPKEGMGDPKKPWKASMVDLTYFLPSQSPSWQTGVMFLEEGEEPAPEVTTYCRTTSPFVG